MVHDDEMEHTSEWVTAGLNIAYEGRIFKFLYDLHLRASPNAPAATYYGHETSSATTTSLVSAEPQL